MRFGFQPGPLGLAQIVLQLTQTLLAMLNALLDACDITADRIEAPLNEVEALRQFVVPVAQTLDAGVGIPLFRYQRLKTDLLIADHLLTLTHLIVQRLPAQRRQLGLQLTLLGFVLLIFLRRLRLAMQALQLTLELFAQIGQASQVFMGSANTIFSFAAALLVLGDTGRLFDEVAQVFRLGLDQLGDHALLDDRVAACAKARA